MIPLTFYAHAIEMETLQLQVEAVGGNWNAVIIMAAHWPVRIADAWTIISPWVVTEGLPPPMPGSAPCEMLAEYRALEWQA